jgi:TldD protein
MIPEMMETLTKILSLLQKSGDLADIFWEETYSTTIISENKRIEKVNYGIDRGIGLRILRQGETIYGYTNDLSPDSLYELARFMSKTGEEAKKELPQRAVVSTELAISPLDWPLEKKVDLIKRAEQVAWGKSSFIKQVKVVYRERIRRVRIFSSLNGFVDETQVRIVFYVQAVAEKDGILQTGYEPWGASKGMELFKEKTPEEIAEVATERALKMLLKATPAPGGTMPVVLSSEAGGTMIHEAIGHGLEADLATEGLSVYANKIGEQVASPLITVIDDPTLKGHYGFYTYDDEGTPAQRTVLIEKGVLKTYLYNLEYALKQGVESNGHGRRQSYRHKPIPRMGNTFIAPGETPPEDIIKAVEKGIFVRKMGGGQVNTINGDFVFEAAEAYLLEKGKIGEPVRGATLVGNGPRVLQSIAMVGNDLNFGFGTCGKDGQHVPVSDGQPTLLLPEIVVGGTV